MVLLQADEPSAAIVFSTLNTTRARLDLVNRVAPIKISDRKTRGALDQVVKHSMMPTRSAMNSCTRCTLR